jgi:hypothetical protein
MGGRGALVPGGYILGGRGVLGPGGEILTAAHSINCDCRGKVKIITNAGASLIACPYAVEPEDDIAVLCAPDEQEFPNEADAFAEFLDATLAVEISTPRLEWGEPLPVYVLNSKGVWIEGTVTRWWPIGVSLSGAVMLDTAEPIRRWDSGGPVVDEAGALVGVLSRAKEVRGDEFSGSMPLAYLALQRAAIHGLTGTPVESD